MCIRDRVATLSKSESGRVNAKAADQSKELARLVRGLGASTMTKAALQTSAPKFGSVAATLNSVVSEDAFPFVILPDEDALPAEVMVHADHELLASAIAELFRFATGTGSRAKVESSVTDQGVSLAVSHQGTLEPELSAMLNRADTPDRREKASTEDDLRDLLNIRYLVEAAGGTLVSTQNGGDITHTIGLGATGVTGGDPSEATTDRRRNERVDS